MTAFHSYTLSQNAVARVWVLNSSTSAMIFLLHTTVTNPGVVAPNLVGTNPRAELFLPRYASHPA